MEQKGLIVALIYLIVHLVIAVRAIRFVVKSPVLSRKQKMVNGILCLLVPFLWSNIIRGALRQLPGSDEVDVKNDYSSSNFYESGKGFHGR